jgi:hypothetical protein
LKIVRGCPWKFGVQERASRTGLAKAVVARREIKVTSFAVNIRDSDATTGMSGRYEDGNLK